MRKTKIWAGIAIAVIATVTIFAASSWAFADQTGANAEKGFGKFFAKGFSKGNPAKVLENQKERLRQQVKDGKMTQEEADKAIAKIGEKAKAIQEFNSMTLEQKREKLLNDFTASINQRVKDGKVTQEQADKCLSDFKSKLNTWDGTGRMPFMGKGFLDGKSMKRKPDIAKVDPAQLLEKRKADIQQRVKDGKLTQTEADKAIAQVEAKVKEMQEFNSLTLEQKREKLLNDFTASISQRVKDGKLTQAEADKNIAEFKTKLSNWDGSGRMPFHRKGFDGRGHFQKGEKTNNSSQSNAV
ncbi:MAG: hypothetical protein N2484_06675 [Clostridia bacterium]|nr:hypothetical protein [Clostridia bacterium]